MVLDVFKPNSLNWSRYATQEVFISTQNLTVEVQDKIMADCPGLLISASRGIEDLDGKMVQPSQLNITYLISLTT